MPFVILVGTVYHCKSSLFLSLGFSDEVCVKVVLLRSMLNLMKTEKQSGTGGKLPRM